MEQKRAILLENLQRLGGITYSGELNTLTGEPWFYRNRIQLHFDKGQSGFHRHGSNQLVAGGPLLHLEPAAGRRHQKLSTIVTNLNGQAS